MQYIVPNIFMILIVFNYLVSGNNNSCAQRRCAQDTKWNRVSLLNNPYPQYTVDRVDPFYIFLGDFFFQIDHGIS